METVKKTITKTELAKAVSARMNLILKERNITQAQLVKKMQDAGYSVLQSDASKILADKAKASTYFLVAFSEVLGISLDELVYGTHGTAPLRLYGGSFQIDPAVCDGFRNILGEYFVYFCSTNRLERNVLISGRLSFVERKGFCEAVMVLEDIGGRRKLKKTYSGQLVLSRKMSSGYVMLNNESYGEISMLVFRYRDFLVRPMECRLALAVTVSSGESKKPTAHRLAMARRKLGEEERRAIMDCLQMENRRVVIEKEAMVQSMEQNSGQRELLEKIFQIAGEGKYLFLEEEDIRKLQSRQKISNQQIWQIKRLLGEISEERFSNVQVGEEDDAEMFALVERFSGEE